MMGEKGERTAAVVLAAGQGKRMQSGVAKQYLLLKERPVIWYSLEAFEKSPVDEVILVTGKEETDWVREHIVDRYGFKKVRAVVAGGAERYHSVCRGLSALDGQDQRPDLVLIHDGARPLISEEVIRRTIEAAREYGACVAAVPVVLEFIGIPLFLFWQREPCLLQLHRYPAAALSSLLILLSARSSCISVHM